MNHLEQHPQAGQTITIHRKGEPGEEQFTVEDWCDRVMGQSWMWMSGNHAVRNYAYHAGLTGLPVDDEVVYGKIGAFGYLVHVTEFVEEKAA